MTTECVFGEFTAGFFGQPTELLGEGVWGVEVVEGGGLEGWWGWWRVRGSWRGLRWWRAGGGFSVGIFVFRADFKDVGVGGGRGVGGGVGKVGGAAHVGERDFRRGFGAGDGGEGGGVFTTGTLAGDFVLSAFKGEVAESEEALVGAQDGVDEVGI